MSSDTYWSTLAECESSLIAVYKTFSNDNILLTGAESNRSDLTLAGTYPAWTPDNVFYNHTFSDATTEVGNRWAQIYEGVFRANQTIEGLDALYDSLTTEDDLRQWELIMGQARFFRGLFHMYASLSYNNGNVPIMDFVPTDEEEFLQCSYAEELVREFYIAELEYAESVLPAEGDSDCWSFEDGTKGRVTSGAASSVLGTIYLYNKEYDKAKEYFEKVINNPNYKLTDCINDNFDKANEYNSESILEINYTTDYNTEYDLWSSLNLTTAVNFQIANSSVGGWGSIIPSYWLYRDFAYEPVDRRNEENKVYLEHDTHGDIYFLNDRNEVATTSNGKIYYSYLVLRKDKIDAGDTDAMTFYTKTVEVDASGDPVITDLSSLSDTEREALYDICLSGGNKVLPVRAYANMPDVNTQYFTMADGNSQEQQFGECWKVFYDNAGEPYRYKVHSPRASYSTMMPTEYDLTFYQKKQGLEVWSINNAYGCFRKFTNWDLAKETDASPQGRSAINVRVIRLADVYLMYAEALIEGGTNDANVKEAITYINKVRERAGTVLIGTEVGAEFQGSRTYQDSIDPEESTKSYMNLYNRDGEDSLINTAEEVMDHLMYKERPLELCLEGFSIRYNDMRRWGITKNRFTELNRQPFTTQGLSYYKPEAQEAATCWTWSRDYADGTDPKYQYVSASINYNDTKAYFPIPNDEATANPNIYTVLTEREIKNEEE